MKRLFTLVLLFLCVTVCAQQISTGISYQYMQCAQMDNLIRTYNFTRPFYDAEQPLLRHGLAVDGQYLFAGKRCIKAGVGLSYWYAASVADNNGQRNTFAWHWVVPSCVLRCNGNNFLKKGYAELCLSVPVAGIFKIRDGVSWRYDDKRVYAPAYGVGVNLRAGYTVAKTNAAQLVLYGGFGYLPYIYLYGVEKVVNQTQGLTGTNEGSCITMQLGVSVLWQCRAPKVASL